MKHQLIILLCLFNYSTFFAQSEYDKGFKIGYKEGYCYNDVGCIAPIPPVTPIINVGENIFNYKDGYNRGFAMGLNDKNATTSNSSVYERYTPGNNTYISQFAKIDYETIINMNQLRNQIQVFDYPPTKTEATQNSILKISEYYTSFNSYPKTIPDGWHNVIATSSNLNFCKECKVFVNNNKIEIFSEDNYIKTLLSFIGNINNGKTIIAINEFLIDGSFLQLEGSEYLDIYFLEYLSNPNSKTTPLMKPGKVSFWTNAKRGGAIEIRINNCYFGTLTQYFSDIAPNCEQFGTLVYTYKPGTYSYTAKSNTMDWSGTITITEGGCSTLCLNKK